MYGIQGRLTLPSSHGSCLHVHSIVRKRSVIPNRLCFTLIVRTTPGPNLPYFLQGTVNLVSRRQPGLLCSSPHLTFQQSPIRYIIGHTKPTCSGCRESFQGMREHPRRRKTGERHYSSKSMSDIQFQREEFSLIHRLAML